MHWGFGFRIVTFWCALSMIVMSVSCSPPGGSEGRDVAAADQQSGELRLDVEADQRDFFEVPLDVSELNIDELAEVSDVSDLDVPELPDLPDLAEPDESGDSADTEAWIPECQADGDCDDDNPCTTERCVQGTCEFLPEQNDVPCDDHDPCTLDDTCQDGECVWERINPLCQAICGDGVCSTLESGTPGAANFCAVDCGPCGDGVCGLHEMGIGGGKCPKDCLAVCGNGKCEGGESTQTCLLDCSGCPDGVCGMNETFSLCPADCPPACGNGLCEMFEGPTVCPVDCKPPCGDGICASGEDPVSCPTDCPVCGDHVCALMETIASCPQDCATACGNGICEGGESADGCPVDCGPCGDGTCGFHENPATCPVDCFQGCGDGVCAMAETCVTCPVDCGFCCGNAVCEPGAGETQCSCPDDCGSCSGCCQWEVCFPGTQGLRCGTVGEACHNCGSMLQSCVDHVCEFVCGDGHCGEAESVCSCQEDCGDPCADLACGSSVCGGDCGSCPVSHECVDGACIQKALWCGDGTCSSQAGENTCTCPSDCGGCAGCCEGSTCRSGTLDNRCGKEGAPCGNCTQSGQYCREQVCVTISWCGDGTCDPDESCQSCETDCGYCCGNGLCDPQFGETKCNCVDDCGPCTGCCQEGTCLPGTEIDACGSAGQPCWNCLWWDSLSCVDQECVSLCGDGQCASDESCATCPDDCGCTACGETCEWGDCVFSACWNKNCGDDGCGGSCGTCSAHHECQNGLCQYVPWCGDGACQTNQMEDCATCPDDCGECCGNGVCEPERGEDLCNACPEDCGSACGDGCCTHHREDTCNCPDDCGETCGDGCCNGEETNCVCPQDCYPTCGDGCCAPGYEDTCNCTQDCGETCGDGCCTASETTCNCPNDCGAQCGDGCCNPWHENTCNCTQDCGETCGDGCCTASETTCNCPNDCGAQCGDGCCNPEWGENTCNCTQDCGESCGDWCCTESETTCNCPNDCGAQCGDGCCNPEWGESSCNCTQDCGDVCGDHCCTAGESTCNCIQDCGEVCGDGCCTASEHLLTCPEDCPDICGDDYCSDTENCSTCEGDCGVCCGNLLCEPVYGEDCTACTGDCGPCLGITPGFVELQAGSFWMGSPGDEPCPLGYTGGYCDGAGTGTAGWELGRVGDETLHLVELTRGFEIQALEVTQGQWKAAYSGWNPSAFPACGESCPVESVSWFDAAAYANARSLQAGLRPCYVFSSVSCRDGVYAASDYRQCMKALRGGIAGAVVTLAGGAKTPYQCIGYRLPTEAEWEYAARAGSLTAFYPSDGNDGSILVPANWEPEPNLTQIGWYAYNTDWGGPRVTGLKEANSWDLYDMSGNVWEWCSDLHGPYPDQAAPGVPLTDPYQYEQGWSAVIRGGSWSDMGAGCRSARRTSSGYGSPSHNVGFRLVRTTSQSCVPDCSGKECGSNGCGGTCGQCDEHGGCRNGQCVAVPWCGDGLCHIGENEETCPGDCGDICGNGSCDPGFGEHCQSCPADCGICMESTPGFSSIPPGSFWMGSPGDENCPPGYMGGYCDGTGLGTSGWELGRSNEETLHYVSLTRGFELQSHEITQGQWRAAFGNWNPSHFQECGDACPVESISWYDAVAYANWLSAQKGLVPCYTFSAVTCTDGVYVSTDYRQCMSTLHRGISSATILRSGGAQTPYHCVGYRLPTEAEWEYAARAGDPTAFHTSQGNDGSITYPGYDPLDPNLDQIGWYAGNTNWEAPRVVGGKESNPWGLHDMSGNLWEWCEDQHGTYPTGSVSAPLVNPCKETEGWNRVLRGGSWLDYASACRSAARNHSGPGSPNYHLGFRLARTTGY